MLYGQLLNIIVFVTGAVIMILELTGSRILAPHIGTSLPVWTSIIGVILGSLSLGYYAGGKLADRKPSLSILSLTLLISSLSLAIVPLFGDYIILYLTSIVSDLRIAAVITSIVLFLLPSVVLGMVAPYAIRLKLKAIKNSGTTAGTLYALSTIGSIFGTFLAGFFLLAVFRSTTILFFISFIMLFLGLITAFISKIFLKPYFFCIVLISLLFGFDQTFIKTFLPFIEVNTPYNAVRIYEYDGKDGARVREMLVGNVRMSAMYLDKDELVYDYTKYYRIAGLINPNINNALMIGGAGYSYPKDFIENYPNSKIDVVEIDPGLTDLAKKYFKLKTDKRLVVFHQDARTFLNNNKKKYDVIFSDAFSSHSIPFQLTTREAVGKMHDSLNDEGVIITNTISSIEGDKGKFLRAEYHTYKTQFPYVYAIPVQDLNNTSNPQNIILIASKKKPKLESDNKELQRFLSKIWEKEISRDVPILTDDFAPVEQYEFAYNH